MIQSNINGPMPIISMSGSRYVLTFIYDMSRFTWVFFLKKIFEVLEKFIDYKDFVENASGRKIRTLISDNEGEYIKSNMLQICAKSGINIEHTIPYTPQQNGVTERKNRALKEMTTCMLEAKDLAANIWAEAMNVVSYIQNNFLHSSMKEKTPFEA